MCSINLAILLLTLASGVSLLIWGFRNEGVGIVVAKVFGFIIIIISSLMFLSVSYSCLSHVSNGKYSRSSSHHRMHNKDNNNCNHKQFCKKHMQVEKQN
tara:strand:+ start:304 stop:600 length:297 start_codon:yes stop_codon:yes gene_type:complete